ncbi:hypothetical protein [Schaalia suimastitidis]|uniref:hypothetical protein n=1 Tax=Schaalia suimastitidis TaxID=121163 RepID=UPI00103D71EF|nr:hypothetical protein [Schaalia suimastitidis]
MSTITSRIGRVPVVMTQGSLMTGTPKATAPLSIQYVPKELAPSDAFHSVDEIADQWHGIAVQADTILTRSLLEGSPEGRAVPSGHSRISVTLDAASTPPLAPGDHVDVWAIPSLCDQSVCSASLIASDVRIVSTEALEGSYWGTSSALRVDLITSDSDTDMVLGHSGTGTLSLSLRHRDANAPGS